MLASTAGNAVSALTLGSHGSLSTSSASRCPSRPPFCCIHRFGFHDLLGVGGGGEYLGDERVRIERDRRDELLELCRRRRRGLHRRFIRRRCGLLCDRLARETDRWAGCVTENRDDSQRDGEPEGEMRSALLGFDWPWRSCTPGWCGACSSHAVRRKRRARRFCARGSANEAVSAANWRVGCRAAGTRCCPAGTPDERA